jgi:hypothetical protein
VTNEQQVGGGPTHDDGPDLVGGRADHGAPDTGGEGGQEADEQRGQDETGAA